MKSNGSMSRNRGKVTALEGAMDAFCADFCDLRLI